MHSLVCFHVVYPQAKCWGVVIIIIIFGFSFCFLFVLLLFLRHLNHPSIIKYFGTNLLHDQPGTIVMIVLELCNCSLKSQSKPENSPARLRNEAVKRKVLSWAQQILDALRYIHSEGFVHRDLKLDNVLVSYPQNSVGKSIPVF